jgi:hypothetical protein
MFKWQVLLLNQQTGETVETTFSSRWSPRKVTGGEVAVACAAQETVAKRTKFVPINAHHVQS